MSPFLPAVLLALLLAPPPAVTTLRQFLAAWRSGRADLLQAVPGGFRIPTASGGSRVAYARRAGLDRLDRMIDDVRAAGGADAARVLLEAATVRLAPDPGEELVRFAKQQPWALRRRARSALWALRDDEARRFLRRLALTDRTAGGVEKRAEACLALAAEEDAEAVEEILALLGDREPRVRAAAARALGRIVRLVPVDRLAERLAIAVDDDVEAVRAEALLSLRALAGVHGGAAKQTLLAAARGRLGDRSPRLRRLAAETIARLGEVEAVPWLLEALVRENQEGGRHRVRAALRRALVRLTGLDVSSRRPDTWRRLLREHAPALEPLPPDREVPPEQSATFFGVPIESDRVVFLLDASGSMGRRLHENLEHPTRFDLAVAELARAVSELEEGTRFSVLLFGDEARPLFDGPTSASDEAAAEVRRALRAVRPEGGTNLFGALARALGILDPLFSRGDGADTVVLLSDGVPSRGPLLDPEEITAYVREWNRTRGIALQCVSCRKHDPLLETLASDSGGRFACMLERL